MLNKSENYCRLFMIEKSGWESCANCVILILKQIAAPNCAESVKMTENSTLCQNSFWQLGLWQASVQDHRHGAGGYVICLGACVKVTFSFWPAVGTNSCNQLSSLNKTKASNIYLAAWASERGQASRSGAYPHQSHGCAGAVSTKTCPSDRAVLAVPFVFLASCFDSRRHLNSCQGWAKILCTCIMIR